MLKYMENWLQDLKYLEGRQDSTLQTYRRFVTKFLTTVKNDPMIQADVDNFVRGLLETGVSPGYINSLGGCINAFLTWYGAQGEAPKLKMKRVKEPKKHRQTFTESQIKQMINYKASTKSLQRLQVIIEFLLETGCRISEAVSLRVDGVDFDAPQVLVTGKGRKDRIIPMSVELRKSLFKWMKNIPEDSEYVFPGRSGQQLQPKNLRADLQDLCDRLKIPYEVVDGSFHSFRRGFARNYIKAHPGATFQLKSLMGHSNLATTERYVGEIPAEQTAESVQRSSMLARLKKSRELK
jgi:site-specific recombinase XerD